MRNTIGNNKLRIYSTGKFKYKGPAYFNEEMVPETIFNFRKYETVSVVSKST